MTISEISIQFQNSKLTRAISTGKGSPYAKGLILRKNLVSYTVSIIPIPTNLKCENTGGISRIPIEDFNELCFNWLQNQGYLITKCL